MPMVQEYKSLIGLIFFCTMGTELSTCPFLQIRSMPLSQRLELLETLPEEEKDRLVKLHRECLNCRDYVRVSH